MSEIPPCHFWTNSPLLRPIALWSLDTFGGDTPMLIGVRFDQDHAQFTPVPLDPFDPVASMADLVIPDDWDVLAVVTGAHEAGSKVREGVLAHCIDRAGRSATELDDWCGRRRALRAVRGHLHDACLELFSVVGW